MSKGPVFQIYRPNCPTSFAPHVSTLATTPGENMPKDSPAVCRVKIYRQSDEQMKGVRCRAVTQEFGVEVNQDLARLLERLHDARLVRSSQIQGVAHGGRHHRELGDRLY
jgi:hypothetical protein